MRDQHVLPSALTRPQQRWHCDPTADLADPSALCLVGLSHAPGFVDGNKRTGLVCVLLSLALTGAVLQVDAEKLYARVMRVAINKADAGEVATCLREPLS